VDFNGRSSRSEYWYWTLFCAVVGFVLGFVQGAVGGAGHAGPISLITMLFQLAVLLPSIAVGVRRLHDTDKTGWLYLIAFTIIGIIPLLIWFCTRGTPATNKFGDDPLGGSASATAAAA
jgi:uncharacterized membrane protein YhaH (DUF805 family)